MIGPQPAPHIAAMNAYALADLSVAPGKPLISLAQNESLRPPSPAAIAAVTETGGQGALYPDPDWQDLRAAIAGVHGLAPGSLLCGAGSMELIGAIAQAYLGPGDRALTTEHGYLYFRTATALAGAAIDLAPETGLTVDPEALLTRLRAETKVVFVANPGNPTGTRVPREPLLALREALPSRVLLVLDEAYGEFADGLDTPLFDLVSRGDTVVLRTFSKAYGLAAARVGWGVFPAPVAAELRKILNPNNVSLVSQIAAAAAMRDQSYMRETVGETAERRDRYAHLFRQLGISVPESHTNFLLLQFTDPEAAHRADQALRAEGILMRGMGGYGLPDCLRATIGAEVHMALALEILTRTEVMS